MAMGPEPLRLQLIRLDRDGKREEGKREGIARFGSLDQRLDQVSWKAEPRPG